jgi:hypothetical protein
MRYERAMNEQVLARIPMEHKHRLRAIAAERGVSLSELIRQQIATGWLAEMLTAGLPAEGTLFERTRILDLLGTMNWQPSAVGEPAGFVGTSGVKISDPAIINRRVRTWALPVLSA